MTLREARILKKISQQLLAARTGCSQKLISDFERGFAKPNSFKKEAIGKALKIDPEIIEWDVDYEKIS